MTVMLGTRLTGEFALKNGQSSTRDGRLAYAQSVYLVLYRYGIRLGILYLVGIKINEYVYNVRPIVYIWFIYNVFFYY